MDTDKSKPLTSFALFFYNQSKYVKDAIEGALAQDYQNLEIILSDDGSTDNTYSVIQDCIKDYHGPHKIIVNRNESNLGIAKHVNKVLYELCHGEYVVLGAGDDVSLPSRVSMSVGFFEGHKEISSLSTESLQVDSELQPINKYNHFLGKGTYTVLTLDDYCKFHDFFIYSGDSRALRRIVIESFPPFKDSKEEDLELFIRSLLLGPIALIHEPLVKRRIDGNNVSKRAVSVEHRLAQNSQIKNDICYAREKGIIDDIQKNAIINKVDSVTRILINVDNSRRHPLLYKLFRGLSITVEKIGFAICKL